MSARRPIAASISAVIAVLAASSCCLPVLPLVAAAGTASAAAFLDTARIWLMLASVLLIGFAFFQSYRRGCTQPNPLSRILLWTSALMVGALFLFPQQIALWVASLK